jgi:hypothetical protein
VHPELHSARTVYDLRTLQHAIGEAVELNDDEKNPYWRGHGDANWDLKPSIYRHDEYDESSMLWDFITRGTSRLARPPAADDESAWLHLAQHYGLPTRLLDWTMSPMVAAYFAVCDPALDDVDGCLWALNAGGLNKNQVGDDTILVPSDVDVADLIADAFEHVRNRRALAQVLAISALELDLRMLVQQSAFTIHSTSADLRTVPRTAKQLRRFVVPQSRKATLREWISLAGTETATVYPDLTGLATSIKFDFSD